MTHLMDEYWLEIVYELRIQPSELRRMPVSWFEEAVAQVKAIRASRAS